MKDYFLYNRAKDQVICFGNGDVVIYGSIQEAIYDCYGEEEIVTYDQLPKQWQLTIRRQIRNGKH